MSNPRLYRIDLVSHSGTRKGEFLYPSSHRYLPTWVETRAVRVKQTGETPWKTRQRLPLNSRHRSDNVSYQLPPQSLCTRKPTQPLQKHNAQSRKLPSANPLPALYSPTAAINDLYTITLDENLSASVKLETRSRLKTYPPPPHTHAHRTPTPKLSAAPTLPHQHTTHISHPTLTPPPHHHPPHTPTNHPHQQTQHHTNKKLTVIGSVLDRIDKPAIQR